MGWVYEDSGEPVPQAMQPKGSWHYEDGTPVPHDLIPGGAPFQPGWQGEAMRGIGADLTSESPSLHGIFDPPQPGELNPTAQRLEDWLRRKGAPVEQAFPEWAQPIVDPILQPATPTEAAVTGVGAVGTGLQGLEALGAPESFGITAAMIPATRWATSGAQLATALAGGALEAPSGHRIEMAENEAIKTSLGLVLAHSLHIPYVRGLGKYVAPLAHTFAPAVGRVGTPAAIGGGMELLKRIASRLIPAPTIIEGGGGEGGGGNEGGPE